jgi:hypothetical protein
MKIKSGIFLLSVGLCITVGNMAQATDQTAPTREGVASEFIDNSFNPIPLEGEFQILGLRSLKVRCPKSGFLVARADVLFLFAIPAKLPGFAFVGFSITRGDEEFNAENSPQREILMPFSPGSEEFGLPRQPGSIQRVDGCEKGDEFSYAFNVRAEGTGDEKGLIVTVIEPILVVEFFEKSIQVEDGQNNNGQNNQ